MFTDRSKTRISWRKDRWLVSLESFLTFLFMAINDYRDLDCEANAMATPEERPKIRSEVERLSVVERMAYFWRDYEVGQNP